MNESIKTDLQKKNQVDVLVLSESDVALMTQDSSLTPVDLVNGKIDSVPIFTKISPVSNEPGSLGMPSVSLMPRSLMSASASGYNSESIDDVICKVVTDEPLLTEEDIFFLVKKEYTGKIVLSRRILMQALVRNNLQTPYKRFQAYITG